MNNLSFEFDEIESIQQIGMFEDEYVYDIAMHNDDSSEDVQTFIANDILVHNSTYLTYDYVFESLGIEPRSLTQKQASDFIVYFMQKKMDPIFDKVLTSAISKRNGKSTMVFELETIGGFGIFMAKKKYVFEKLWENGKYIADQNKLKITGIEMVQKSTPLIARNAIKTFINTIFAKKGDFDATTFYSMCASLKNKLVGIDPGLFAKNSSVNKYEEYVITDEETIKLRSKCPIVIRGAATYNHLIRKNNLQSKYPYLRKGTRAKMYYDKMGQPFCYPNDSDFPYEIAPEMSLDIQIEKLIFAPLKRLVSGGMIEGNLNKMGHAKMQKGFSTMFAKKK